ncbi:3-hydroxy-3-methylglutaryl CoA synthase [Halorubrum sp. 48-1-W]|uniref:OB-fold domain-containing protein n=1 Tax=Halorubrum sp. 48-1-W TaxID=2249761 RepID=UPI000DCC57C4|nr:OB-fold domain-containing protein [Halorubrum sp. 48-1-W]RAW45196.1 3-hydroxy-3-methylglutaryl CoA synthase [Halorubrum sp. 48-1-W]
MRGIAAAGAYVPRFRLPAEELASAWGTSHASGIRRKAVPAVDEDALTMAVEAAERALSSDAVDRDELTLTAVATTTPPAEEGELLPRLVRALALPKSVETATVGGHTAAGAEALSRALDAEGPALVVVADCPEGDPAEGDHPLGAGAAAFVVDDDPSAPVTGTAWHTEETPGVRFRERGGEEVDSLGVTTYQRNAVREAVTDAVSSLPVDPADVDAAAVHQPDGRFPYRATADLPVSNEAVSAGTVVDRIGDAGAATVPLGLLAALDDADAALDGDAESDANAESDTDAESDADDAGDVENEPNGAGPSIAAFFGGGTAVAVAVEGGLAVEGIADLDGGATIDYVSYLRERGYVVDGEVAGGGAHVSLPNWRRSLDQRYRLVAGVCPECGSVSFPPEGACQSCRSRVEFTEFEAPRTGTVRALTVIGQGGAPPEFAELQQRDGAYAVAIVELDADAGRVRLPAQITDADPGDVAVGDEVRATVRRIYEQEGVPRYGVKFEPTA